MDRDLYTAEHDAFRDVVRRFVDREVVPNLERWDEERLIDRDTWLVAGRQGVVGLSGPVLDGRLTAVEAAKAKWWATDVQNRVTDRLLQLFGGYGYMTEYPISRAWADARVQKIYGGTNEIMKHIIAREIVGSR